MLTSEEDREWLLKNWSPEHKSFITWLLGSSKARALVPVLITHINDLIEGREFMLDKYSEVGARACWICHYEEGKFKKLCRLHVIISEYELYTQKREE